MTTKLARKMKRTRQRGHGQWPAGWDEVEQPVTDAEADRLVAESAMRLSVMTDRLHEMKISGDLREAKQLSRTVLHSDSARIAAMAYSVNRKLDDTGEVPGIAFAIVEDALSLDMWWDTGERVTWSILEPPVGKLKINYGFGILEYARQYLALRVADPLTDLHPRQFILRGGMTVLIAWLNANVPFAKVVVTTDVPSCFFALNRECAEADTPLPGAVMRSVLFEPMDRAKQRAPFTGEGGPYPLTPSHYGCGAGSAWGIPRGSALASLVAEISLRPILDAVEGAAVGVVVAVYGDNIIMLAPSAEAADAMTTALLEAASTRISPDAVEGLCTRIVRSTPAKGFEFVRSRFRVKKGVLVRRAVPNFDLPFELELTRDYVKGLLDPVSGWHRVQAWLAHFHFEPKAAVIAVRFIEDFGLHP